MKRAITLLMALVMCLSLCACGGSEPTGSSTSTESSPTQEVDKTPTYSMGECVETVSAKLTLNNATLAIALNNTMNDTYLEPKEYSANEDSDNPYVANDGAVLVYYDVMLAAIGRSTVDIRGVDFTAVEYNGKVYTPDYDTCKISTGASNILLLSGEEKRVKGYFEIPVNADLNSDFKLIFSLPNGADSRESFTFSVDGNFDYAKTTEKPKAVCAALKTAYEELDFVYKYAGNVSGNGSRKFSDERITALETCLSELDIEYIANNLPAVSAGLETIRYNMNMVKELLVEMGETNSDKNVYEIKDIALDTKILILECIEADLVAYW